VIGLRLPITRSLGDVLRAGLLSERPPPASTLVNKAQNDNFNDLMHLHLWKKFSKINCYAR